MSMKHEMRNAILTVTLCAVFPWSSASSAYDPNRPLFTVVTNFDGSVSPLWNPLPPGSISTVVTNADGSIGVVFTKEFMGNTRPPVVLSPEAQEKQDLLEKLRRPVEYPYNGDIITQMTDHTFGQLAKRCDWVAVGTIEKKTPVGEFNFAFQILFSVDTCLYGKLPKKKLTFYATTGVERILREKKPGDRMLVFLTDKEYQHSFKTPPSMRPSSFDFDRKKLAWEKREEKGICLCAPFWSYIFFDDKDTEEAIVNAVKGYLGFFGEGGKRDRDGYYEFLCSLLQSPVERVRHEAESDLLLFFTKEKDPPPDLDKLLADGRVRKEVKDYLRYLLRNEKPSE